ncbi:HNH endonuclease signature motif containing protein [Nocardioides sp. TF02-7]|uniref:HNH endonuclease signature motif containing protein n=1 Tax=Nocardioides sp. TF02-7 TaxID=2917724 RepID=UPI001F064438|nr:HNH endonuclease signature motif containing protein [Nocardioides sp. TF02-7]UMG93258.1 HNH endonuclease [Nocardioides sp. TF02-7]
MPSPDARSSAAAAVEAAAAVAQVDFDAVGGQDLLEVAVLLGKVKNQADAALVRITERLGATGSAEAAGWASTKDFLTHALGGRKGAGAAYDRVAKQTAELPAVRAAMAAGDLSLAQAGAIGGRVATLPRVPKLRTGAAAVLVDLARTEGRDATDLDQAFPGVVNQLDPEGRVLGSDRDKELEERGVHHARFLSFTNDTLGGVRIKGYASLEEAELVKATLMPLAAPVVTDRGACGGDPDNISRFDDQGRRLGRPCPTPGCAHDGKDPRDAGARMWDALVETCDRLHATDSLPHAHGSTARIFATTTLDDLRQQLPDDRRPRRGRQPGIGGTLPSGETLSAAAVRRLACDAEIIPAVLGSQSQVLDVGRASRLVTAAIWLALVLRDQHCAFPGCNRLPIACDAHHILHWADGGPTSLDNLVLLCRKHHTLAHRTPWQVQIHPDTRRPIWTPPPPVDDTSRCPYRPAQRPPPKAA